MSRSSTREQFSCGEPGKEYIVDSPIKVLKTVTEGKEFIWHPDMELPIWFWRRLLLLLTVISQKVGNRNRAK